MKKLALIATAILLVLVTGCQKEKKTADNKLVVSATLDPHSKILEETKKILKKEGIELEIEVLDNYYIFNQALDNGEVDANFFQHVPFFEDDVEKNNYDLVNVGGVHIEPFGFYSKKHSKLEDLPKNGEIVLSNSVAEHGRILSILASANVIELDSSVNILDLTLEDITSNPKNLKFTEVNPELLVTTFEENEGDLVAINGNYAISAGLNPTKDALLLEEATNSNPYVNIIAVKKGHEDDKNIKKLVEVLQSKEIKDFISKTYSDGSVIPVEN
ncbi:MAG: MetQ/NlpA family ABC transporter substrate-binding protein [Bacilli bacterium]